jgi:hypothetical protein
MYTLGSEKEENPARRPSFTVLVGRKRSAETGLGAELCRTGKKREMRQTGHLSKELWGNEAKCRTTSLCMRLKSQAEEVLNGNKSKITQSLHRYKNGRKSRKR